MSVCAYCVYMYVFCMSVCVCYMCMCYVCVCQCVCCVCAYVHVCMDTFVNEYTKNTLYTCANLQPPFFSQNNYYKYTSLNDTLN